MRSRYARIFSAFILALAGGVQVASAQSVTLVATPASLTFDVSGGAPSSQTVAIRRADNGPAAFTTLTPSGSGITCAVDGGLAPTTPYNLRVTVTPALLGGATSGSCAVSGTGLVSVVVPISITGGGGTGTVAFSASPAALNFTTTGPTATQNITLSSNIGTIPQYYASVLYTSGGEGWLSVSPFLTITQSPTISVTPASTLTTGTYTASLVLTPTTTGVSAIAIPITVSVNQGTVALLTVTPNPITFVIPAGSTTAVSQSVSVTSPIPTSFFTTVSSNLVSVVTTSGASSTPATVVLTVVNPNLIPLGGAIGSVTFTPIGGSAAVTVPVNINASGTGSGILTVAPAALTFTGNVGSTTPPAAQSVQVSTPDLVARFFSITTTSTNNFLTAVANSTTTPTTITVGVNLAAITTPGTYTGTITLTPFTGTGASTPSTVTVTLTAVSPLTVTPGTTPVNLTARAGGAAVQQNVFLSSTLADIPFTTTPTTTTGGQWLSVISSTTTLPATITVSANPASLTPGTYQGSIAVTAQNTTVATIPVNLTVTASAALQVSPGSLTFDYQTTGTTTPAPQAVQVASGGTPLSFTATAASTGGWLQVTPSTGTTPASVSVSVNPSGLTPGTYTGSVSIASPSATNTPQSVGVTLNVASPTIPLISTMQNAASRAPSVAVPGLIVTITGTDLGPAAPVVGQVSSQGFLQTSIGDLSVLFDGVAAPILYASPTQINAVVPTEIFGRVTTRLVVAARNQRSRELELRVADTSPGIFTVNAQGSGPGAILNQNGTVNGISNPETRGNAIVIYATGGGTTTPSGVTGRVVPPGELQRLTGSVSVLINGAAAEVFYAGAAPGLITGAVQINARIPQGALGVGQTGPLNVPLEVRVGGVASQPGVTVAIQ